MCGIAGIFTQRSDLDLRPVLRAMQGALRHRGPDDEGLEEVPLVGGWRLGLVHTRLSILDLSSAGHQPMSDPATGSWITYNGEVYNHQAIRKELSHYAFSSSSDTETILAGWVHLGHSLLSRLRGMFAFALYDGSRHELWLVRDRMGVKPLYVAQVERGTWIFASEVRAILASGLVSRDLNSQAIESYLAFGALPAPWTIVKGVESLMPGECWKFQFSGSHGDCHPSTDGSSENDQSVQTSRMQYWHPPFAAATNHTPHNQSDSAAHRAASEALRPVLLEAVSLRMVSDVPVGVFLSGGIDSSAVVGALSFLGHELRTFSVIFGERDYDESKHARLVARRFGANHTELLLNPRRVLDEFDQATQAYDQPSIDGINTYFISQATHHAGVKVALSGLGGDELFAGYSHFRLISRLERVFPRLVARLGLFALQRLEPHATRTTKLNAVLRGAPSRLARYAICREVMDENRRQDLLVQQRLSGPVPLPESVAVYLDRAGKSLDSVNAHSLFELSLYLANMLLRDTDVMSMAHGLEVREPLLDHVLVERVAEIRGVFKLMSGREPTSKALLVDALPSRLPRQVLRRRKMGFVFPWERWLRGDLKSQVTEIVMDVATVTAAGMRPVAVAQLWSDFLSKRPGIRYTDILSLVHLLRWVRHNQMRVASPMRELAQSGSKI